MEMFTTYVLMNLCLMYLVVMLDMEVFDERLYRCTNGLVQAFIAIWLFGTIVSVPALLIVRISNGV